MKATLYIALAGFMLFASCKPAKELVFSDLQNFEINQGTPPGAKLDIRMYNPNKYQLKLKNSDVSVSINGNDLGKLHIEGKHLAPALDTFLLPVSLNVNPQYTMLNIMQWAMSGDVRIKVTGKIKGGRHGLYINVPVNYEGTQNLQNELRKF